MFTKCNRGDEAAIIAPQILEVSGFIPSGHSEMRVYVFSPPT